MFSATFPRAVEALARALLSDPVEVQVGGRSVVNSDVTQIVELRPEGERFLRLLELLGEWYERGKALVFVQSQDKCDALFRDLLRVSAGGLCGFVVGEGGGLGGGGNGPHAPHAATRRPFLTTTPTMAPTNTDNNKRQQTTDTNENRPATRASRCTAARTSRTASAPSPTLKRASATSSLRRRSRRAASTCATSCS